MKNRTVVGNMILLSCLSLGVANIASAGSATFPQKKAGDYGKPGPTQTFTENFACPAGQELNSVTVSWDVSRNGTLSMTNDLEENPATGTATHTIETVISLPGTVVIPTNIPALDQTESCTRTATNVPPGGTQSWNPCPDGGYDGSQTYLEGSAQFNDIVGKAPNFTAQFGAEGQVQQGTGASDFTIVVTSLVGGTISLKPNCGNIPTPTPTPTPPPPPASAISPIGLTGLLAFLPLAGVFFFRRRK